MAKPSFTLHQFFAPKQQVNPTSTSKGGDGGNGGDNLAVQTSDNSGTSTSGAGGRDNTNSADGGGNALAQGNQTGGSTGATTAGAGGSSDGNVTGANGNVNPSNNSLSNASNDTQVRSDTQGGNGGAGNTGATSTGAATGGATTANSANGAANDRNANESEVNGTEADATQANVLSVPIASGAEADAKVENEGAAKQKAENTSESETGALGGGLNESGDSKLKDIEGGNSKTNSETAVLSEGENKSESEVNAETEGHTVRGNDNTGGEGGGAFSIGEGGDATGHEVEGGSNNDGGESLQDNSSNSQALGGESDQELEQTSGNGAAGGEGGEVNVEAEAKQEINVENDFSFEDSFNDRSQDNDAGGDFKGAELVKIDNAYNTDTDTVHVDGDVEESIISGDSVVHSENNTGDSETDIYNKDSFNKFEDNDKFSLTIQKKSFQFED